MTTTPTESTHSEGAHPESSGEQTGEHAGANPGADAEVRPSRRWRGHRSVHDRYVAGVLGGLGERFSVDPFLFRLVLVGAAVAWRDSAVGLLPFAYAAAWLVIPEPGERSLLTTLNRRASVQEALGALLVATFCTMVLAVEELWLAAALAIGGWALLVRSPRSGESAGLGAAPTPTSSAVDGDPAADQVAASGRGEETGRAWGQTRRGLAAPLAALRSEGSQVARRQRDPALWPLTVATLGALVTVFVAMYQAADYTPDPRVFLNLGLIAVGAVIALSAWRGRSGLTILFAVPLVLLIVAFSLVPDPRTARFGTSTVRVASLPEDGHVEAEMAVGTVRVVVEDGVVPDGETLELDLDVAIGSITVEVPANLDLVVDGDVRPGSAFVDDRLDPSHTRIEGLETGSRSFPARGPLCVGHVAPFEDFLYLYPENLRLQLWEAEGDIPDRLRPSMERYWPVVPEVVRLIPEGALWRHYLDQYQEPCEPEPAPVNPGTLKLNANVDLGVLQIVRTD